MSRIDDAARRRNLNFLLILALAVSFLFFRMIQDFLIALVLAGILAGIAFPFHEWLVHRLGGRRSLAAGITVVAGVLIVVIPLLIFLALVANAAVNVGASADDWVKVRTSASNLFDSLLDRVPNVDRSRVYAALGTITQSGAHYVAEGLTGVGMGTLRFFVLAFVFLYAEFQFLLGGAKIPKQALRLAPLSESDKHRLLKTFTSVTQATLLGAVVIGLIQGGLAGLGFAVAGVPSVLFWTAIMVVLSVIPGIGSALVWVPAVGYLLFEGRVGAAIGLGAWCTVMVGSVDNFLRPMIVGKSTKLPNLLVLVSTLGGLACFGLSGLVLGPVIAALFLAVWDIYADARDDASPEATGRNATPSP